jgi:hypothetical protein
MRRAFFLWPLIMLLALPEARADARMSVLFDVMQLNDAAHILSSEGITAAQALDEEMLSGQGGAAWQQQVAGIYDAQRMAEGVRAALTAELTPDEVEAVIDFYATDLGAEIIEYENTARVVMGNSEAEAAARGRLMALRDTDAPRLALINAYISSGDMITRNVTNEMNASYQFLRGLVDGRMIDMSESQMLQEAARDIDARTRETTEWLQSYLLLAYDPLTDVQLEAYITFVESDAGQALNRALYAGFETIYEDISYALGRAVALNIAAQDL